MADARIVANRFLELAAESGKALTPMQVLKLVYIAHGWMLGLADRPLINQPVEAWQYGPVIRDLYNAVRQFQRGPVQGPLLSLGGTLDAQEENMVEQVYGLYGHMDGIALSNITHMPGTPWEQTYVAGSFGLRIPEDLISGYYKRLARERSAQPA